MTPFYVVLGAVAVVGIGFLAWQSMSGSSGGAAATSPLPVAIDPSELASVQGISMGREDAPVVIYEFADFQCPGCGEFATFVTPVIKDRLVNTGKVRYVYYDFPLMQLHAHAFLAARAGRCANEQGKFWEYHDLLYGQQARWSGMRDPTSYFIEDLGSRAGLDEAQFAACVRSDKYQEEVSRSLQLGQMLQVGGTPTLFINMKRVDGVPDYAELERMVLAEAGTAPAPAAADTAAAAPAAAASGQ
jgi:protein-disulfide isomerase